MLFLILGMPEDKIVVQKKLEAAKITPLAKLFKNGSFVQDQGGKFFCSLLPATYIFYHPLFPEFKFIKESALAELNCLNTFIFYFYY